MLRFRNSNRRFTRATSRFTPRNRFAGRRNFRAADDVTYVVRYLSGSTEEDSYNEGLVSNGNGFLKDIEINVKAPSIKEVIFKVAEQIGIAAKDVEGSLYIHEDGSCSLAMEENAEGMPPTQSEWKQFEKGEINLYYVDYSFNIEKVVKDVSQEEVRKAFPNSDYE